MIALTGDGPFRFKIDALAHAKGSVQYSFDVEANTVTAIKGGTVILDNISMGDFTIDGINPVADILDLMVWFDTNANELLPESKPFKIVSTATVNSNMVKAAQGLLQSITAINTSVSTRYLKIYDCVSAPTDNNVPIFTIPLAANTTYYSNLLPAQFRVYLGIGLAITANIADDDTTAIGANEVVINGIYR